MQKKPRECHRGEWETAGKIALGVCESTKKKSRDDSLGMYLHSQIMSFGRGSFRFFHTQLRPPPRSSTIPRSPRRVARGIFENADNVGIIFESFRSKAHPAFLLPAGISREDTLRHYEYIHKKRR